MILKKKEEGCAHVWEYTERSGEPGGMMRCRKCGAYRMPMPWETAIAVARDLNIRHDGKDGDV